MLLTYRQLERAYEECDQYDDRDQFVREFAVSIGAMDEQGRCDIEIIDQLRDLWRATHITIQEIKKLSGLSYTDLARRFGFNLRTVQTWTNHSNGTDPPRFVLMAMLAAIEQRPFDHYPIVESKEARRYHPEVSTNYKGKHPVPLK